MGQAGAGWRGAQAAAPDGQLTIQICAAEGECRITGLYRGLALCCCRPTCRTAARATRVLPPPRGARLAPPALAPPLPAAPLAHPAAARPLVPPAARPSAPAPQRLARPPRRVRGATGQLGSVVGVPVGHALYSHLRCVALCTHAPSSILSPHSSVWRVWCCLACAVWAVGPRLWCQQRPRLW